MEKSETPPHITVRLRGRIDLKDLCSDAPTFEWEVEQLSSGFVLLIDYSSLQEMTPEAVGVVFYLTQQIFDARPKAVLVVQPRRPVHGALRPFAERLDKEGRLHLFRTLAEANAFLQMHYA